MLQRREPVASSPAVYERMRRQRRRDTAPEMALRRAIYRRGLRYRLHLRLDPLERRTADVVFPKERVAVFVDGCFWHGCPDHGRSRNPVNGSYWLQKIERNRIRDADTTNKLRGAGWRVVRVWEHQEPEAAAESVEAAVKASRRAR